MEKKGQYGSLVVTKDVLFDLNMSLGDIKVEEIPSEADWLDPGSFIPFSQRDTVHETLPVVQTKVVAQRDTIIDRVMPNRVLRSNTRSLYNEHGRENNKLVGPKVNPYLNREVGDDAVSEDNFDDPDFLQSYWYRLLVNKMGIDTDVENDNMDMMDIVEQVHFIRLGFQDSHNIPKTFEQAMSHPNVAWQLSVDKEQNNFEVNQSFSWERDIGQLRGYMNWIFDEKKDGSSKSRLVFLGNRSVPYRDFDPDDLYNGNVSSVALKITLTLAAAYGLLMQGGDIDGAYLVPRGDPVYKCYVHTPKGWDTKPGHVLAVDGNVYGKRDGAMIFGKLLESIILKQNFLHSPYDPKFYWKWSGPTREVLTILVTHSDDFRMFYALCNKFHWDDFILALEAAGFTWKDTTKKPFVGIQIDRTEDGDYTMNQKPAIDELVKSAGLTGAKIQRLPYPTTDVEPRPFSKLDNLSNVAHEMTEAQINECRSYPYRRQVGKAMYIVIHTGFGAMYGMNILSKYGNDMAVNEI